MSYDISQIYARYKIPSWLATHMYRVAAVAAALFDARAVSFGGEAGERNELIAACLLHDMGNIIKFDFTILEDQMLPEGKEYWQGVRTEMIAKYGESTHAATEAIARELAVSPRTFELIQSIGFMQAADNLVSGDTLKKIAAYADMRVMPLGVAPLENRLADLRVRYDARIKRGDMQEVSRQEDALRAIESELFAGLAISPADITEGSVSALRAELAHFTIPSAEGSL